VLPLIASNITYHKNIVLGGLIMYGRVFVIFVDSLIMAKYRKTDYKSIELN